MSVIKSKWFNWEDIMPKLIKEHSARITVRLPEQMLIQIKNEASLKSLSVGRLIRDIITAHLSIWLLEGKDIVEKHPRK